MAGQGLGEVRREPAGVAGTVKLADGFNGRTGLSLDCQTVDEVEDDVGGAVGAIGLKNCVFGASFLEVLNLLFGEFWAKSGAVCAPAVATGAVVLLGEPGSGVR